MKPQARRMTKAEAQALAAWSARRQPSRRQAHPIRDSLKAALAMLAVALMLALILGLLTAPFGLLPVR